MVTIDVANEPVKVDATIRTIQNQADRPLYYAFNDTNAWFYCNKDNYVRIPEGIDCYLKYDVIEPIQVVGSDV